MPAFKIRSFPAAAERVDGDFHEIDASRRERLALVEVLELHVVAHDVRYELLAAEYVRDRLAEQVAHLVVLALETVAAEDLPELIALRLFYGAPAEQVA